VVVVAGMDFAFLLSNIGIFACVVVEFCGFCVVNGVVKMDRRMAVFERKSSATFLRFIYGTGKTKAADVLGGLRCWAVKLEGDAA
jgi:hypothetical protein